MQLTKEEILNIEKVEGRQVELRRQYNQQLLSAGATPTDMKMYNSVKKSIYKKIPKHSAYRSGRVVAEYKKRFKKKYGSKSPYKGKKNKNLSLKLVAARLSQLIDKKVYFCDDFTDKGWPKKIDNLDNMQS